MNLSDELATRVTSAVNNFGDCFAQDPNTKAMHQCLAVMRRELVEECDPITHHPEIIEQLDWIDRTLDRIEARRRSTIGHIAMRLQRMLLD